MAVRENIYEFLHSRYVRLQSRAVQPWHATSVGTDIGVLMLVKAGRWAVYLF